MRKLFEDSSTLTYKDLEKRKDTKKDGASKFYSLLVLQKVNMTLSSSSMISEINSLLFQFQTLDISQDSIYGDISIVKGASFDSETSMMKN